jgi:[ribosomal protein S18]-alanine N-acetyltransferase
MADIRRMTREDLPLVAAIQAASPEAAQWSPPDYLGFETWVAVAEGAVAGFLSLRETAPDESEILNLAVQPSFRRRGLARQLLARALSGRSGEVYLEVRESNADARSFYSSAGFSPAGKRPNYYKSPTETAIVMKLQKW